MALLLRAFSFQDQLEHLFRLSVSTCVPIYLLSKFYSIPACISFCDSATMKTMSVNSEKSRGSTSKPRPKPLESTNGGSSKSGWNFVNVTEPSRSKDAELRKVVRVNAMLNY